MPPIKTQGEYTKAQNLLYRLALRPECGGIKSLTDPEARRIRQKVLREIIRYEEVTCKKANG